MKDPKEKGAEGAEMENGTNAAEATNEQASESASDEAKES